MPLTNFLVRPLKNIIEGRARLLEERVDLKRELTQLREERNHLHQQLTQLQVKQSELTHELHQSRVESWVPPGHYYSPIPSLEEVKASEDEIFGNVQRQLAAVDLNEMGQLELFDIFTQYYREMPFGSHSKVGLR